MDFFLVIKSRKTVICIFSEFSCKFIVKHGLFECASNYKVYIMYSKGLRNIREKKDLSQLNNFNLQNLKSINVYE